MSPLSDVLSDANSLQRISIQVTKSQYELLKEYARPGTSISSMIRRAIDDMFQPVIEQRLEEMKMDKWEKVKSKGFDLKKLLTYEDPFGG